MNSISGRGVMTMPGGVDGGMADLALELLGDGQKSWAILVFLSRSSWSWGIFPEARVRSSTSGPRGDHLGDPVHLGKRHLERPADVPDGRPGGHGPEGDDLADVFLAVLVR